jgi:antagonist of KipI
MDELNIRVLSPGLLTTVQDGGRCGFGAIGVGCAGAMDTVSLRLANLLVGNGEDAAALEITLRGPRLRFAADTLIAVTGAEIDVRCGDERVPHWRPVLLRAGSELNLGGMRRGARAYLAIAGGIDLPALLGSRSTDVNAGLGPVPRPLAAGDELPYAAAPSSLCADLRAAFAAHSAGSGTLPVERHPGQRRVFATSWSLDPAPWFDAEATRPIRAIAGSHFEHLDGESQHALFAGEFRIGVDSNRVGCRLEGVALKLAAPIELISAGTAPGTVQLPPGGVPIALTAEAPPTGGYPRIAQIIAIDLPHLAQRRPGDSLRFAQTDLADAQMRYLERERALAGLAETVRWRLREAW